MKAVNFQTYKQIRKMSLNDLNKWVLSIYKSGYLDGLQEGESESVIADECVAALTDERLKEILLSIKGIGEKRAEMVLSAVLAEGISYPEE